MTEVTSRLSVALALTVASTACGGDPVPASATVRDSAGITIVENTAPKWDESSAWHLSEDPVLTIGVVDGLDEYQLHRASKVFGLTDGRLVIANNGTYELRYYDAAGMFIRSVGGNGGGPGEFERIRWLAYPATADTVVVIDPYVQRVSLFDTAGRYVDGLSLEHDGQIPRFAWRFADGTYVTAHRPEPLTREAFLELPLGIRREKRVIRGYNQTGKLRDTLAVFPDWWSETLSGVADLGRQPFVLGRWYSPFMAMVVFGDSMYVGIADEYEIGLYDNRGTLHRIVRRKYELTTVTEADRDRAIQHRQDAWSIPRFDNPYMRTQTALLSDVSAMETFPAYGDQFLVDANRNLWVEQYDPLRASGEPERAMRFDVFDQSGFFLGAVELPPNFELTDIGDDYVLGLWEDDLEVQYALKYELVKPGRRNR